MLRKKKVMLKRFATSSYASIDINSLSKSIFRASCISNHFISSRYQISRFSKPQNIKVSLAHPAWLPPKRLPHSSHPLLSTNSSPLHVLPFSPLASPPAPSAQKGCF